MWEFELSQYILIFQEKNHNWNLLDCSCFIFLITNLHLPQKKLTYISPG